MIKQPFRESYRAIPHQEGKSLGDTPNPQPDGALRRRLIRRTLPPIEDGVKRGRLLGPFEKASMLHHVVQPIGTLLLVKAVGAAEVVNVVEGYED